MKNTKIAWATHTFNPWIGCEKVSAGCANCYAEAWDNRMGWDRWGKGKPRMRTSAEYWNGPLKWDREAAVAGERPQVFCASLADIFDDAVPEEWRTELFDLIKKTPNLDWLLLTKRHKDMKAYMDRNYPVPLPNVWLGVTVENQENSGRIATLLDTPAVIHWLSVEPQIGPLNLEFNGQFEHEDNEGYGLIVMDYIDWVVCGGESGSGARPFDLGWARSLRDQCREHEKAFFMKQLGEYWGDAQRGFKRTRFKKWDDLNEFPEDLRIREFPKLAEAKL